MAKRLIGSDKSFPKTRKTHNSKKNFLPNLYISVNEDDKVGGSYTEISAFTMEPRIGKSGKLGYYHSEPFLYGGLELVVMVKPPLHPYK